MLLRLVPLLYGLVALVWGSQLCVAQNLEGLAEQKPVTFRGGVNLFSQYYRTSAADLRQAPGSYFLTATPVLSVYGVEIPFAVTLSNQHLAFQQPFNQFGMTPTYKWARLHLGYSAMRFSRYTLDNIRFLGAGVELTPGPLRIGAMVGRLRRAVEPDSAFVPSPDEFLRKPPFAAYRRTAYAFRVGVGSARTGIDLIYLKARDDSSSIRLPRDARLRPAENAVVGLNGQLGLGKHLSLRVETGASVYTRDLTADTVGSEEYARELERAANFIEVRESTQAAFAGEGTLAWQRRGVTAALMYRRVDPEYNTMGSYFFQQDVEQYTLTSGFGLARNKVRLNGSFGVQRNNLRDLRAFTARRVIGSAAVTANLSPRFGFDGYYSNFGITQRPLTVSLLDTTRLEQISQSLSLGPRYTIIGGDVTQLLSLNLGYDALSDLSTGIGEQADLRALTVNAGYNYTAAGTGWAYRGGLIYRRNRATGLANEFRGLRAGASKTLDEQRWTLSGDVNLYQNAIRGEATGATQQATLSVNRVLLKAHNLFVSANLLRNRARASGAAGVGDFTEFTATASYSISF